MDGDTQKEGGRKGLRTLRERYHIVLGVKQRMVPLSHTIYGLYIWWTWIIWTRSTGILCVCLKSGCCFSLCWGCCSILWIKSMPSYQGFSTTCISLEVIWSKTKVMIFGCNKKKVNHEAFSSWGPDRDNLWLQIPWGWFLLTWGFEPSSKRQRITRMKALMGTLRKEAIVKVTCHELQGFGASNFHVCHRKFGEVNWKLSLEGFREGREMHMVSHIKVRSSTTYYILLAELEKFPYIY